MASSAPVQKLLARAHSPDSVNRIYGDKIQHRTLHLRPTSPPPSTLNARASRRKSRQHAKSLSRQRPKPLSSRERRSLGLYDIPRAGQRYELYEPLHALWTGYARELLGEDVYTGGAAAAGKLASAELHGAEVEVVRSRCVGRVGIRGIVVRDGRFAVDVVTRKGGVKTVPKEGTTFRVEVSLEGAGTTERAAGAEGKPPPFAFEILGDQMMLRSADRANKKFKTHFLRDL